MRLHWFDVTLDMPIRNIGWTWLILLITMIIALSCARKLWNEGFRVRIGPERCQHMHTRCIHGDEIIARMKVYAFRWWKDEIVYRQACVDCGASLERVPICSIFSNVHTWEGVWEGAD